MYRKHDVYDGYEREKSGRKCESTVKSRTSHNRVTKNLYSDKFAAYLVRLLYFRRKKRTLLVAKNMNYIERECFAVVFFSDVCMHSCSAPWVCICVCAATVQNDMKMVSAAFWYSANGKKSRTNQSKEKTKTKRMRRLKWKDGRMVASRRRSKRIVFCLQNLVFSGLKLAASMRCCCC